MDSTDRTQVSRGVPGGAALVVLTLAACGRSGEDPRPAMPPSVPVASASAASPADGAEGIFWPVPPGWNPETIPFPLGFAPHLPYRGVEELRFAPGWAKPNQPGYWSYVMVWWLTEKPQFDPATIGASLTAYFRGLSLQVGSGKYQIDTTMFRAELVLDSTDRRMTGRIRSMDAFTTGLPITLNAVIENRECVRAGRHAVTLLLSPRATTDSIWTELRSTAEALGCE